MLMNLGEILSAQARLRPHVLAVQDLERQMSWALFNERACRLGNGLLGLGLKKDDRLAILAYNRLEWAEIYAAAAKAGLIAVPINFRLTGPEIRHIIRDSGAAAIIFEDCLAGRIESIRDELDVQAGRYLIIGDRQEHGHYDAFEDIVERSGASEPDQAVSPDDAWCLMYTSGTTGAPKGAIRNHRGVAMLALMTQMELGLHRNDDALLVMPMCHANSLYFFTSFIYCGGKATIFSRTSFDPGLCLDTFAKTGATFTSLVPTHYSMLLDVPGREQAATDYGRVEKLMISSAPARADTKRAVMEMFPNSGLFELYGSTEAGWVTMLHPDEQFDKLGTVGREVVGSSPIRMLDDAGNEVPDGEAGELFSSSPYQFQGYWNLPDKTAEAFRGDYMTVNDMALRDPDGFIRLIDRKKNMIISGGENIYPSEVETALTSHPAVRDAAVIGQPDPKWGESVHAVIVLETGQGVSEAELDAWIRDRLAAFKRPRGITFLKDDEMPRTATGKILHRELREMLKPNPSSNSGEMA